MPAWHRIRSQYRQLSPAFAVLTDAQAIAKRQNAQFGLSVNARKRLGQFYLDWQAGCDRFGLADVHGWHRRNCEAKLSPKSGAWIVMIPEIRLYKSFVE